MEVGGVRRSARLSTRKRHNSRSESHLACCFDNHSPSPKARKQEKMEGSSKSKRARFRKVAKAPKVMVSRLPLAVRRPPVLQLVQMPAVVLKRMMHFLDVTSLENLAATCDFFNQFVKMRGVTTLNIPFSNKFIAELNSVKTYHKKDVFHLRSLKEDDTCVPDSPQNIV